MSIRNKKAEKEAKKIAKLNKKHEKKRRTKIVQNEEGEDMEITDDEAPEEDEDEEEPEVESEEEVDEEFLKGASRNDPFSLCHKLGIATMADECGLKAWELGENLKEGNFYFFNSPKIYVK